MTKAEIQLVRALADKRGRTEHGLFVAEGEKLIGELRGSHLKVRKIFALEGVFAGPEVETVAPRDMERRSLRKTAAIAPGVMGQTGIETGEIVLSRVVVPEYVVVHAGQPNDTTARDYYVRYKDYIKNVASSEIYSTWPDATLRANILAIMSFTLNRVYTEWYRNKGYSFTITSSTAYDQKFTYGRNIFQSISDIVDEMFQNFLSRPNVSQPILTQYCDGERVTCSNWLSQWGSKYLGDQNYEAIEILRYYYGNNMYINTAEEVSGIPASWPRVDLTIGSTGEKVRQIQEELARISRSYPAIPTVTPDGIYGPATREAVEVFQRVFGLPVTGVIDYRTWFKISDIYLSVSRIAELL